MGRVGRPAERERVSSLTAAPYSGISSRGMEGETLPYLECAPVLNSIDVY